MKLTKLRLIWFCLLPVEISIALPSFGQITPDRTVGTTVTPNAETNTDRVDGGTIRGSNLFHSFQEFNIESDRSVYFSNPEGIINIFSRITGSNPSNIYGKLGVLGNANLFLLNPNGIIFGAGARLDLKGSFVATTADRINFADRAFFSASDPQISSLLTISVPIGLQFGSNPGAIVVQGAGHNARLSDTARVSGLDSTTVGLQLQPGKTLALVGGNLALNGGLLSAPGGRIELGSVAVGSVDLNAIPAGFAISYPNISSFGNIEIDRRALVSVAGTNAGAIDIQGQQIKISDGSIVLVQNQGDLTAGDIAIDATNSVQVIGKTPDFSSSSSLINETVSNGAAGNILITTPQLTIDRGGFILNRTYSTAPGGNIIVNADDVRVNGYTPGDPNVFRGISLLLAASNGDGKGGDLTISTRNLSISGGANVAARPYGSGNGGNVAVKADTIEVTSLEAPRGLYFSLLSAATFGIGNAGNLTIDTRTLSVRSGGRVSASSRFLGNAGSLTINASESIEAIGIKDAQNRSYIGTAVLAAFNQPSTANSGTTRINTPVLNITDGATVFVQNMASGRAGVLNINAGRIQLDNGGRISASTRSGEGGNINLEISNSLQMRHGSFISAEAGGSGNGGNIALNAATIASLENSNITANAMQGRGGNIQITTQGIFRSFDSSITASSQLGVSGFVNISTPNLEQHQVLVTFSTRFLKEDQTIASSCLTRRNLQRGRFVATGNGGLSESPENLLMPYEVGQIVPVRQLQITRNQPIEPTNSLPTNSAIQEATGLAFTPDGKLALVVAKSEMASPTELTCSQ
ncbi:two-partner secretion domain-containing protein [Aerosakkonema funiforme]|uniref:Filamentous hemagglutinin N-terminal domain-containing protein n=2 Tax=Oscillatoriophycideae TaxID=1301283 RepID=A0A926VFB7_9CYAN|nr:filamentous hemagglutinin N-terminal domain-containing protein [Aerosakkonema funiforme]MBD2182876.1 filamentous hemagglutinin N-terminal domain-containing protein [Aerosakkonema funiforme FACHB-1375]